MISEFEKKYIGYDTKTDIYFDGRKFGCLFYLTNNNF